MAVSHHAIGNLEDASFWFIASVGYWLGAVPTCLAWAFYVASKLRQPCEGSGCWDCLANLLVILASVIMEGFFERLTVSAAASSAILVIVGMGVGMVAPEWCSTGLVESLAFFGLYGIYLAVVLLPTRLNARGRLEEDVELELEEPGSPSDSFQQLASESEAEEGNSQATG
eukprot:Skav214134  [mRNA]  locus=scaffold1185:688810:691936:- [translate_table: standard]